MVFLNTFLMFLLKLRANISVYHSIASFLVTFTHNKIVYKILMLCPL